MNLFNLILDTGTFPDLWKVACIVPLHKGGCKKVVNNYRPISLLPIMGKLLEKALHRRIYRYLEKIDFFADEQCGFRPNLGTEDAISNLLEYFYNNINNKKLILSIYFDLSKAFDTIDHIILRLKLRHSGITDSCLKLLTNYLSNRKQYCKANGIISSQRDIICGVPQGSTLGPLLFVFYINDVVKYIPQINMSLYADDTVFYWGGKDMDSITTKINEAARKFQYWCQMNKLTLNTNKSKIVLYNNRMSVKSENLAIKIGNTCLDSVPEYKYLGVILDSKLQFVSHVNSIKQKISYRMATLRKVRWTLGYKEALTLYKSCILPFFDQGSLFYNCATVEVLKGLQTLQNKCLRIVVGKKEWEGTEATQKKCKLLSVSNRRIFCHLKYAHKLSYIQTNLREEHTRSLRSNRKVLLKEPRSNCRQFDRCFVYKSVKWWNSLPEEFKKIRNIFQFKQRVKIEMLMSKINFPE